MNIYGNAHRQEIISLANEVDQIGEAMRSTNKLRGEQLVTLGHRIAQLADKVAPHSALEAERLLAITRENFEAECADMDKVLALFPDLRRTEGGRLPVAGLMNAICDLSARCKTAEALRTVVT